VTNSTVFIDDLNDNPPIFDKPVYNFASVDEDFVGRLSQIDILVFDPDLVIPSLCRLSMAETFNYLTSTCYETQKDSGSYVMSIEGSPEIKSHLELSPNTGRNNGTFSLRITSSGLLDYEDSNKRNVTFTVCKESQD
jgi:hypothetical protein